MSEPVQVYEDLRRRVTDLVRDAGPEGVAARVPACPDWTVKDAVAHVTGIVDDVLTGTLSGVGGDEWTEAQVGKRRGADIEAVLNEWEKAFEELRPKMEAWPPEIAASIIADAVTHEHDVRAALGSTDARDSEAVHVALGFYVTMASARISGAGLPPLALRAGDREWRTADGEPVATLIAPDEFELMRVLTGRRTDDEVRSLDWQGDPEPFVPLLSNYGWPSASLGE